MESAEKARPVSFSIPPDLREFLQQHDKRGIKSHLVVGALRKALGEGLSVKEIMSFAQEKSDAPTLPGHRVASF